MKFAIASSLKNVDGEISVGGRAPYFLIFDDQQTMVESLKNPFAVGGGGAGPSVAKMLADMGVTKLVSNHFGEKMINALKERNIDFEEVQGLASEYLDKN